MRSAYTPRKLNYHRRHDESVVGKLLKDNRVEQFFAEFSTVQGWIADHYRLDDAFEAKWEHYLRDQWRAFFPGRPFEDLAKYYPLAALRERIAASRASRESPAMKWFFGFNEGAGKWFAEMVKVAVVTGQTQAPHLEPHCLYDGDGDSELTLWLRGRGVTVHHAVAPIRQRLSAADILMRNAGSGYDPLAARGFYLCWRCQTPRRPAVGARALHRLRCDVHRPVDLAAVVRRFWRQRRRWTTCAGRHRRRRDVASTPA